MSDLPSNNRFKVGIVGLGLIGGSIGLALRDPSRFIIGCDNSSAAEAMAVGRQCVDEIATLEAVAQCDVVFLGVPPGALLEISELVESKKGPETVVTDCCSVKSEISNWALKGNRISYVPGHPMAGHEKSGCEFSSGWLFRGAKWILTPNSKTLKASVKLVESLIKEMGATVVRLDPTDHDRHVGLLSHLPHVIAAALVLQADRLEHLEVGAGSWKDLTRVGGVDPKLWTQILKENKPELTRVLDEFILQLGSVRSLLQEENLSSLEDYLADAQRAKLRQTSGSGSIPPPRSNKQRKGRI